MTGKKNILLIIGSAGRNSSNHALAGIIAEQTKDLFNIRIFDELKSLPHFDPELSIGIPPREVIDFRSAIERSNGILICTPEYVYSIPSGLKNAIEWCISTTVFFNKPTGIITASSSGQKAHEQLLLIMDTVSARFSNETALLIPGIKGKLDACGGLTDRQAKEQLNNLVSAFNQLLFNDL